ncbi:DUF1870 family protein [Mycetocola tolaasinivorans]|uniref:DUF1870 family protein n=1 Tax=Mycetocola tolaasinivorans TaxID=76635 RepID=A0A3L7A7S1_9MICO|nr:DUF1870 family protein [Mycetocola tolaasinivorans]RLP76343.1 DUF1870 family protein [Mycetocola tolaasinivorans]
MTPAEFRAVRESIGLSIEAITRLLSVSRSIVQKWEAGASPIPAGVADALTVLESRFYDQVEKLLDESAPEILVYRRDLESWADTGLPARWHSQAAAQARATTHATISYRPDVAAAPAHDPMAAL